MKYLLPLALLLLSISPGFSQMVLSSGSHVVVNSGSTLVVDDLTNTLGTITNNGTVTIKGDVTNNSGDLMASSSTGTVEFAGSSAQEITGADTIKFAGTVTINNSNGVSLTSTSTGSAQEIDGTLNFSNGTLTLNTFDLIIGSTDPTGAGSGKYIKTNSTGTVKRTVGSSDVLFPVGNSAYNPITLNNSGTSDTYSVRVVDSKPTNGSSNHMVNRSWVVGEATSGGSTLAVTAQWNSGEELTDFDRTSCAVGLTTDDGSSYTWGTTGAASGSDPYTRTYSGFSGVGTFAVGDYYYSGLSLDLKFFLAGAYNSTNHNMDKDLNTAGLVPTSDPYNLSTTVTSVPSDAVDWVEVQLRSSSDNTDTVARFAKFITQAGQVVEEDGSTNMLIKGVAKGSYYVSVHHRNHLPVMSNATVDFSGASPSFDFTTALSKAWDDATVTTNDAMKEVESGVYGLWEGDANNDGYIKYNGSNADRVAVLSAVGSTTPANTLTNVYNANDVNMDGSVKYNGSSADRTAILSVVGSSTPANTYQRHLPH